MEEAIKAANEHITNTTQTIMDNAKGFETPQEIKKAMIDNFDRSKETYEKLAESAEDATKEYESLVNKAQKSGKKIGEKVILNTKKNTEAVLDNMKAMLECNDVNEAVQLHTQFVQRHFGELTKQGTELVDLSKKTTEELVEASSKYAKDTTSKFQTNL